MSRRFRRLRTAFVVASLLAALAVAFAAGYFVGINARGPQYRVIAVVRGTGNPKYSGTKYQYFDISKPWDAARLRKEERRLKSIGARYSIDEAHVETSISPRPDLIWANARR